MIQDLHSHTYYSFCGKDSPETVVEAAIAGGIEMLGICDHNYGIGFGRKDAYKAPTDVVPNQYPDLVLRRYYDHISLVKEKYADRIRVLCGIEITAQLERPKVALPADADVSFFDYCMIENPDLENSLIQKDLFRFAERCGCPHVGVAHTDMFAFIKDVGEDPYRYFKRMAEQGIFWEMNVSYDSIHKYREHAYVSEFFQNKEQQAIVREAGVRVSIGFDGHRVEDYLPDRVADRCRRLTAMGIKMPFEDQIF